MNAIEKVFAFAAKRFISGKLDGVSLFFTENGETILKVHAVGIKDKFLFVRSEVIENGHLFIAYDYKTLLFERMKPTDEDMRSAFIGKTQVGNGNVGKIGR